MPRKMYLLCGISGSGKSTFANSLLLDNQFLIICSADHYMVNRQGLYEFNPDRLHFAHGSCIRKAEKCLDAGFSVAIDNTNTKYRDIKDYISLAKKYECDLEVHFFAPAKSKSQHAAPSEIEFAEFLASRTVHKVPLETILRQMDGLNELMANFYDHMEEDFPDFVYESEMHPIYIS